MTALAVIVLAAVCAGLIADMARTLRDGSPGQRQERLFIPPSSLPRDSPLRVAPVLVAAETRHWAEGPPPRELGPDTPRTYRQSPRLIRADCAVALLEGNHR